MQTREKLFKRPYYTMFDFCTSEAVMAAFTLGFFKLSWNASQVKSSCNKLKRDRKRK